MTALVCFIPLQHTDTETLTPQPFQPIETKLVKIETPPKRKSIKFKVVHRKLPKIPKPKVKSKPNLRTETRSFLLTAYTNNQESTGKSPGQPAYGITASGVHTHANQTLACPKYLKFGTKIYIPYFNRTYICEDTGGMINGNHIDVFMPRYQDAINFGARHLKVMIESS